METDTCQLWPSPRCSVPSGLCALLQFPSQQEHPETSSIQHTLPKEIERTPGPGDPLPPVSPRTAPQDSCEGVGQRWLRVMQQSPE